MNESPELNACGTAVRIPDPANGGRTVCEDQVGYFTCDFQESDGRLGQTKAPDSLFMPIEASPGLALPLRRREPLIRKEAAKTQFVLTGFSHQAGLRVFGFEAVAADQSRTKFSVSADIAFSRSHGIRVQELPLLCIRFLEQHQTGDEKRDLALAEEDMCVTRITARRNAKRLRGRGRRGALPATLRPEPNGTGCSGGHDVNIYKSAGDQPLSFHASVLGLDALEFAPREQQWPESLATDTCLRFAATNFHSWKPMVGIDNLKERGVPVLAPGVILIRNDARLPQTLIGGMSSFCRHWSFLTDDSERQVLEARLAILGWTSSCLSGAIRRASTGIDAQNMIKTALERVLAPASLKGCNFLEIGDIKLHSFLTIRYASALGHARQLRRGTPCNQLSGAVRKSYDHDQYRPIPDCFPRRRQCRPVEE